MKQPLQERQVCFLDDLWLIVRKMPGHLEKATLSIVKVRSSGKGDSEQCHGAAKHRGFAIHQILSSQCAYKIQIQILIDNCKEGDQQNQITIRTSNKCKKQLNLIKIQSLTKHK